MCCVCLRSCRNTLNALSDNCTKSKSSNSALSASAGEKKLSRVLPLVPQAGSGARYLCYGRDKVSGKLGLSASLQKLK